MPGRLKVGCTTYALFPFETAKLFHTHPLANSTGNESTLELIMSSLLESQPVVNRLITLFCSVFRVFDSLSSTLVCMLSLLLFRFLDAVACSFATAPILSHIGCNTVLDSFGSFSDPPPLCHS